MRRVMLMLSALGMVVGVLAGPVAAAPAGNAANAAKCEEGGYLDYTGFTPNSQITYTVTYSPSGVTYTGNDVCTDAMGAFTLGDDFGFCFNDTNTSIQVTATDSEKVSATESLALSCGGT